MNFTFSDVKMLVQQEKEPERGLPGNVANQNMRCPWRGEEHRRLTRAKEHGYHCGHIETIENGLDI